MGPSEIPTCPPDVLKSNTTYDAALLTAVHFESSLPGFRYSQGALFQLIRQGQVQTDL